MVTLNNINQFRKSYDLALNEGKQVFIFEGMEVLTVYAKYVIQYFESKIHNN